MSDLIQILKELLGSTVALRYKAHGYHWNVETDDFPQWHDKFGEIYESLDGAIDPLAEWIRMLGDYAPFKLSRFNSLSSLPETEVTSDPEDMAFDLYKANELMVIKFQDAFDVATNARQQALANFFAERMGAHQKWSWQLKASCSEMIEEQAQSMQETEPQSPTVTA